MNGTADIVFVSQTNELRSSFRATTCVFNITQDRRVDRLPAKGEVSALELYHYQKDLRLNIRARSIRYPNGCTGELVEE